MMIEAISILANVAIGLRLFAYRRGDARYKLHFNLIAYVLILASAAQAIDVVVNGNYVSIWQAITSVVLAIFVFGNNGNVAGMIRRIV